MGAARYQPSARFTCAAMAVSMESITSLILNEIRWSGPRVRTSAWPLCNIQAQLPDRQDGLPGPRCPARWRTVTTLAALGAATRMPRPRRQLLVRERTSGLLKLAART